MPSHKSGGFVGALSLECVAFDNFGAEKLREIFFRDLHSMIHSAELTSKSGQDVG